VKVQGAFFTLLHNPNHWVQLNNYCGLDGELNSLHYY